MNTNNNSIISKFISKEIEHIYSRYTSIPDEEVNNIRNFIEKVEENHIDFDPYLNYNTTKEVAEICTEIEDIDFLKFYLLLRYEVRLDISLEDAKEAYRELIEEGYCKVQGYYLYKNEGIMKDLARDELDANLEDTNEVTDMFSIEEIADMWIFGTSKEEAARQYLNDNDWHDILECEESKEGYTDSYGETIYYCYNGEE